MPCVFCQEQTSSVKAHKQKDNHAELRIVRSVMTELDKAVCSRKPEMKIFSKTEGLLWGGKEGHYIERRLQSALFETYRNLAKISVEILNLATVGVLGMCLYASPLEIMDTYVLVLSPEKGYYIHIGVGSDVVCSISMGNARASIRGIDNRTIPRFFMYRVEPTRHI